MTKTKGKNPDKMCQLILKIYHRKTETITRKSSIYLLGMSNLNLTLYLKLDNTQLLHLFVDLYILQFFLKKKT